MPDMCCLGCPAVPDPDETSCLFCLMPDPDESELKEAEERHLAYQLYMAGY